MLSREFSLGFLNINGYEKYEICQDIYNGFGFINNL